MSNSSKRVITKIVHTYEYDTGLYQSYIRGTRYTQTSSGYATKTKRAKEMEEKIIAAVLMYDLECGNTYLLPCTW